MDASLVRRLPDDIYTTPGRRPAKAAAKSKGQIRVRENLKTKATKLSTSELATMPKLQKLKDEAVDSTSKTILEEGEASTSVRLFLSLGLKI